MVAQDALNLLTDDLIEEIADKAIQQSEMDILTETRLPVLTAKKQEVETSIKNITTAVEKGIASETLMTRLVELEHEKKNLEKEIKAEEKYIYKIDRHQIVFWLSQFRHGDVENENCRRQLIDLLINSVTVWDEPDGYKITTAYNLTSCKTKTFRISDHSKSSIKGFVFEESWRAIGRESEPCIVWGSILVQTKRHPLF
nr:MAG TPA: Putative integrase [Caudoviricetes sp.]